MSETVAPEYARFVADERRAQRLPAAAAALPEGVAGDTVFIDSERAGALLRVAARRAAGLFRPSEANAKREVVWVSGGNELAVSLDALQVQFADGLVRLQLAVRCDQTGTTTVTVSFACGSLNEPTGLYAATPRRPVGAALVVTLWGDALVAFAWQCLLGLATGMAAALGKDQRGNVLVPVELVATAKGLVVAPMARHHFAGSSGLKPAAQARKGRP